MNDIAVLGAGAFGTAMAIALARGDAPVTLWTRDAGHAAQMRETGFNSRRLPDIALPPCVHPTADLTRAGRCGICLVAVPMQQISGLLETARDMLDGKALVACAKGVDLTTGQGPTALLQAACPQSGTAMLTGPSFAADIAGGLPTALTLACADDALGARLQARMSGAALRLYRTTDVTGAELGGALKNVIAIAAGIVIGAGLGDSARAALMTRGYAEMVRLAHGMGARPQTLSGLSGLGDLVLTCTSHQSRNFRFGHALGAGQSFDSGTTVEGAATAQAVVRMAARHGLEMPVTEMVAAVLEDRLSITEATTALLTRPLKEE